ncbi:universal stress protein [Amycolatopsis sp. H20-H5]|uniref:universal stress protein n=1 Tax=Amycolatopsis sp. H20-H5 TaxID=3046309 RepID=UPI002DBD5D20|nr:universal stress protein [Amycolatopsis sp. H20-H5]MEC3981672.1 universal stress protein [Amycolatopsis sp. H20-H5]
MSQAAGTIVVGVDGSAEATSAVRWAAAEAAPRDVGVHLLCALNPIMGSYGAGLPIPQSIFDDMDANGRRVLDEATKVVREIGPDLVVTTEMPLQTPIPVLIGRSAEARTLVLGSSGRGGFAGMLVGSTTVAVAAHAHCPVVVVRGRDGENALPLHGPVVVGVDGSPTSDAAVGAAFDEASWRKVPLVAVHAWSDADYTQIPPPAYLNFDWGPVGEHQDRQLAESLAGWQEKYPDVTVERVPVKDRPRHELLEWATRAQLVVVGTRGRGGFRGLLLGSTSQALIHHAQCPVMILRQDNES